MDQPELDEFQAWVAGLEDRFGTKLALAEAIGMSLSAMTRGVAERSTLGVENLLEAARIAEEHPSKVLRMAGKSRVAELIEQLYGPGVDSLKDSERVVIELWRRITDPKARDAIVYTMTLLASSSPASLPRQSDTSEAPAASESAPEAPVRPVHTAGANRPRSKVVHRRGRPAAVRGR